MKTFVAVLCALLATAGVAFAHGTAGGGMGGAPVMSPASMPVFAPVMTPIGGGGSSTSNNFPVYSPSRPAPLASENTNRRHKQPVTNQETGPVFVWDPKICRPPQWLFTPNGAIELNGAYTCGFDDSFVAQNDGPIPKWLPPAFLW